MKKVLITGAAGFIGSHLTDFFLAKNYRVSGLDSLKYGTWENLGAREDSDLSLYSEDLTAVLSERWSELLDSVDVLLHFGAEKHNNSAKSPQLVNDVNVIATQRLFEAAVKADVGQIVFASSLYASGETKNCAITENVSLPDTVYGVSKLAGEGLLRSSVKDSSTLGTSLRLFFTYGSRQYPGLGYPSVIISNFQRLKGGKPPIIRNDGLQELDYIHVSDVVRAVESVIDQQLASEVINIGNAKGVTIEQLTETMQSVAGTSLQPVYEGTDWTADTQRVSDRKKARELLKWSPRISLNEGLAEVWQWFKEEDL